MLLTLKKKKKDILKGQIPSLSLILLEGNLSTVGQPWNGKSW